MDVDDDTLRLRRLVEAAGLVLRTCPGGQVYEVVRHGRVVATCVVDLDAAAVVPGPHAAQLTVVMSLEDVLWDVLERDPPDGMPVVRPAKALRAGGA